MGLKPTVGLNVSLCQISPPPAGLNERYTLTLSHMNSPPLRFLSSLRSHDGHDHLLMFNHGNCSTFRSDVTSTNLCVCVCVRAQKDSHTVYLEQELESLKVVLEIKNNQLHQKEKKLMEMDKLVSIS